jgi:hypothetical protein
MARSITIALNFPKIPVEAIAYARNIATQMQGNACFPSPPVLLSTLLAAVVELEEAEVATKRRTLGMASERDAKLAAVHSLLRQLATYVVTIARQQGPDGPAVVAGSGFSEKRPGGQGKWSLVAVPGARSGEADLRTERVGRGASYDWQYGTDGVHWLDCARTSEAKTTLTGLTPGALYHVRFRSFFRGVESDWSDPITFRAG